MVEGWKSINLGQKCIFERGIEPGSSNYNTSEKGKRFLRVSDLTDSREDIIFTDVKTDKNLKKGDICISLDGTVGIVRDDLEGVYSTGIRKVNFSEKEFSKKFIYYILKSDKIQKIIKFHSSGSTIIHAGKSINYFDIEIPEFLPEQQKIAEILTKVDETIEATEKIIAKDERIKKGLMQDLFSKGIDENGNLRSEETHDFRDSELGRIPKEWNVMQLGVAVSKNKGSIQTGPFGSQLHAEDYKEEGIPIITVEHLSDNEILHDNVPLVGDLDYKRLHKYVLKKGDLVFSRVGAIDRCSSVSDKENGWLFSGRCLRVRCGNTFDSMFLSYQLNHYKCKQWILNNAVGTTMACLNTKILSELPTLIPHLEEQQKIASILSSTDSKIQQEKQELNKLKRIKQGLMQDLLTGKVRVNHLINDAAA
ncbi:hypothetical protein BEH94_01380 [Candidatus Altiarchaeales archaeon WOR_SM1_SCG]|nr:hypothetical protein BEH94_01380 [Candidatus Altiarchaeales archaeon WOR_SM1_SCG]